MAKAESTNGSTEQPFLVRFFDPKIAAEDYRGRNLDDIVSFTDDQLEMSHDYIQILFPLPEGSAFNWQSPIIDEATFEAFRAREDLRASFQRGFVRIASFYGFDANVTNPEDVRLTRSKEHIAHFRNWVVRIDHNHLRMSRVIRSLRVLGLEAHATAFYDAVLRVNEDYPHRIGLRSMMYWKRAAKRPLYLAPDEDDDDAKVGPKFLLDWEANKDEGREHSVKKDEDRENSPKIDDESDHAARKDEESEHSPNIDEESEHSAKKDEESEQSAKKDEESEHTVKTDQDEVK